MSRDSIRVPRVLKHEYTSEIEVNKPIITKSQNAGSNDSVWIVIFEVVVLGFLFALNYLLRYNESCRYSSDMTLLFNTTLTCDISKLNYELSHPYYSYEESSSFTTGLELSFRLPEWVFLTWLFVAPAITFCLVEFSRFIVLKSSQSGVNTAQAFHRLWRILGTYLFGLSITGIFISTLKLIIVSPRPHFMSICYPWNSLPNVPDECNRNGLFWKPFLECVNQDRKVLLESLKSFPSYHGGLAIFSGIFTALYVIIAGKSRQTFSAQMILVAGIFAMSSIGALHRMLSAHSFPRDILGGAVVAVIMAFLVIKFIWSDVISIKMVTSKATQNKPQNKSKESNSKNHQISPDFTRETEKIEAIPFFPRLKTFDNREKEQKNQVSEMARSPVEPRNYCQYSPRLRWTWSRRPYSIPRLRRYEVPINAYTNYGFAGDEPMRDYQPSRQERATYSESYI